MQIALVALCSVWGCAADDDGVDRCGITPSGRVELPGDDGAHAVPVEWWYWTGHLQTVAGRWFGFEEVFFHFDEQGVRMRLVNFAITDIEAGEFHYYGQPDFAAPSEMPAGGYDHALDTLTAVGGDGSDVLHGEVDGYVLDLTLDATRPPVLQHEDGYTDYPFGGYTYYYSRERMAASGTLALPGGEAQPVTGLGWFDHQWGDLRPITARGWDWFAIQLDDGRELMLFLAHPEPDGDEPLMVGGSYRDADCRSTEIAAEAVTVTPLDTWTSPATSCSYPMGWEVRLDDPPITLTLTPVLQDQELASSHETYWEGAATVGGDAVGRAYIELNGYCETTRASRR